MQSGNKTAIIIITYNCQQIFVRHIERIKKHCKDQHDIIIIDNSTKSSSMNAIRHHSKVFGVTYIRTSASSENSSDSHSFAANFSYNLLKDKYTHFFYLDHDCFPVKDFSVIEILGDKQMAGIGQQKEKLYFWPGCLMFVKQQTGIDFSPQTGLDTGGSLYELMEKIGHENLIFFNEEHVQNPEFNKSFYNFYSMINNKMFCHMVNASNWSKSNDNEERINSMLNVIERL